MIEKYENDRKMDRFIEVYSLLRCKEIVTEEEGKIFCFNRTSERYCYLSIEKVDYTNFVLAISIRVCIDEHLDELVKCLDNVKASDPDLLYNVSGNCYVIRCNVYSEIYQSLKSNGFF